jgi:hypothetical protein
MFMNNYLKKTAAIICTILFACTASSQLLPKGVALKVVIIRHGEKPANGDNLSCAGLNRALALPAVLDTVTGKPDYTYVPTISTGKKTSNVRMFQTVTPFAVKDGLTINSTYKETATDSAAKEVLKKRGVVLMVWEHSNIPPLAKALGVPGKLQWNGTDFDSIWIIEFTESKKGNLKFLSFTIEQENITPSNTCK